TAVLRTAGEGKANQGRQFWCCPNSQKADCKFFEWADADASDSRPNGPNGSAGQGSDTCFKCGQPGHWSSACTSNQPIQSRSFSSRSDNSAKTGSCYKCGEEGHYSSACPQGASGQAATNAGGSSSGTCYKCGEPGHYANACPNSDRPNKRATVGSRGAKRGRGSRGGSTRGSSRGSSRRGRKKSNFNAADEF
ncbi:hypothetical protein GLOTRDRAFT_110347, partial [Gloeophyllum trabeum ATCC 11539]